MRDGPTTQPAITGEHLLVSHASSLSLTGLKSGPACPDAGRARHDTAGEIAALGKLNNRAINPSFLAFLCHFCRSFKVQNVISRTSAPAALRLPPTFAAASQQNATASPPLANTRRQALAVRRSRITNHESQVTPHLIYGTGIKKLRKPTPINEYKLLIYGKPRPTRRCTPQNR